MAKRRTQLGSLKGDGPIHGAPTRVFDDLYHFLVTCSWPALIGLIATAFTLANLLFATGYYFDQGIENAHSGSFADMFFFSVQTMATIGYGKMVPVTLFSNILVSIEALTGLLALALMTGLVFSKFSRPTARVRFTRYAVIGPRDGALSLMIRAANMRANRIVEANIHVVLARQEITVEGDSIRRLYDLAMTRSRSAMFALSWTAVHRIVEGSPLFGETRESLASSAPEIIVSITGLDETFSQTVHARHTFKLDEIVWGARLADVLVLHPDGSRSVDYTRFDDVEMLTPAK
ncbi:MAG TPA: ion channel [Candidatus Binatus sp.]|uniref:ion channel n=1 Tax=Candidatus Binatus sp. TaxID=2811406 RepID=UPI002B46084F|nr:ion channel [Candidatus Binatus sp.]HKN12012.1 ion channel [Candidatus Binatus sp.]